MSQAHALYLQVLSTVRGQEDRPYEYLILLLAENDLAAGRAANAVRAAAWLAERPCSSCDYFMHQRALRMLAQYELDQGNAQQAYRFADRAMED